MNGPTFLFAVRCAPPQSAMRDGCSNSLLFEEAEGKERLLCHPAFDVTCCSKNKDGQYESDVDIRCFPALWCMS